MSTKGSEAIPKTRSNGLPSISVLYSLPFHPGINTSLPEMKQQNTINIRAPRLYTTTTIPDEKHANIKPKLQQAAILIINWPLLTTGESLIFVPVYVKREKMTRLGSSLSII
jgi:hypothetical protein